MSAIWRRAEEDLILLLLELTAILQVFLGILALVLYLGHRAANRLGEMGSDRRFLPANPAIAIVAGKNLINGILISQQPLPRGRVHLVHTAELIEQAGHVGQPGIDRFATRLADESEPSTRLHFLPDGRGHGFEIVLGICRDNRLAFILGNGCLRGF